jgi:hypothetical protein
VERAVRMVMAGEALRGRLLAIVVARLLRR